MSNNILHLVGADASPAVFDRFSAAAGFLADGDNAPSHDFAEVVVSAAHPVGRWRIDALRHRGVIRSRIRPSFGFCGGLSQALTERLAGNSVDVVHAWSAAAVSACFRGGAGPISDCACGALGMRPGSPSRQTDFLIDALALRDPVARQLFTRGDRLPSLRTPQIVCESDFEAVQLAPLGVSRYQCCIAVAARPSSVALPDARTIRDELQIAPEHRVVVLIPPIERWAGAFIGAWATLVLEKLQHELRLVIPGVGQEVERLVRLVDSIQHDELVRFPGDTLPLPALLKVADAALLLSDLATPRFGVLEAQTAAVPILASVPAAMSTELRDGENAWVCPPAQPKLAAQRLMEILSQPEEARRRASHGRPQPEGAFDRATLGRTWAALYADPVGAACCNSA